MRGLFDGVEYSRIYGILLLKFKNIASNLVMYQYFFSLHMVGIFKMTVTIAIPWLEVDIGKCVLFFFSSKYGNPNLRQLVNLINVENHS